MTIPVGILAHGWVITSITNAWYRNVNACLANHCQWGHWDLPGQIIVSHFVTSPKKLFFLFLKPPTNVIVHLHVAIHVTATNIQFYYVFGEQLVIYRSRLTDRWSLFRKWGGGHYQGYCLLAHFSDWNHLYILWACNVLRSQWVD